MIDTKTQALKILLVEDAGAQKPSLASDLSHLGLKAIEHVNSVESALEKYPELTPDVIIIDPDISGKNDGFAAAVKIRAKTGLPIILIINEPNRPLPEIVMNINPIGYIRKPTPSTVCV